jgi:hypothetical protein
VLANLKTTWQNEELSRVVEKAAKLTVLNTGVQHLN